MKYRDIYANKVSREEIEIDSRSEEEGCAALGWPEEVRQARADAQNPRLLDKALAQWEAEEVNQANSARNIRAVLYSSEDKSL